MTHCMRRNWVVAFERDQVPAVVHPTSPLLADRVGCSYFVPARVADPSSLPILRCGRQGVLELIWTIIMLPASLRRKLALR